MYTYMYMLMYVMHVVVYMYTYVCSSYFPALSSIATLSYVYAQYAFLIDVLVNYWKPLSMALSYI